MTGLPADYNDTLIEKLRGVARRATRDSDRLVIEQAIDRINALASLVSMGTLR